MIFGGNVPFLIAHVMNEKRHNGNYYKGKDFHVNDLQIFLIIWVGGK